MGAIESAWYVRATASVSKVGLRPSSCLYMCMKCGMLMKKHLLRKLGIRRDRFRSDMVEVKAYFQ
jgi:hypothetical protein